MTAENRNGVVDLDFGDGPHRFRLAIGELEELQEKTGIGPYMLMKRLVSDEWRTVDVRETLRLGLIGGGMDATKALALTRRYVDERGSWIANAAIAMLVITAALAGAPEELPGKENASGAETEVSNFPAGASPSAPGMRLQEPSASELPISDP